VTVPRAGLLTPADLVGKQLDVLHVKCDRAHREISFISPLFHIIGDYLRSGADTIPQPPDYVRLGPVHGSDPALEAIFRRNMQAIHAVNSARGIKSLFVGQ
jgi:hypothetical protein